MISRRRLLMAGLGAAGIGVATPARAGEPVVQRLANGLTVIIEPDRRARRVGVALRYSVGVRHEPRGYRQIAHLAEHLMFRGSAHVEPAMHFGHLAAAGAHSVGGFTAWDCTVLHETVPTGALPLALWLESDRMGFALDRVGERDVELEREILRNEARQRHGGDPIRLRTRLLAQRIFPSDHPYHREVENPERFAEPDIDAIGLADVAWFMQQYYRPERATLALVGDVDPSEVLSLVRRYFESLRSHGPDPVDDRPPFRRLDGSTDERIATSQGRAALSLGWPTAPLGTSEDAALDVIARHLTRPDGPLRKALVDRQLATRAHARQHSFELASIFEVSASASELTPVSAVAEAADQALETLHRHGITPARRDLLVARMALDARRGMESFGARAMKLATTGLTLRRHVARYEAVTPAAIEAVLTEALPRGRRASVAVWPA
ncbi:MAG: pitrilysin family protein [Polyangiaceae bacterium]